jgi:polysaccharide biosynthesis protein PslG
MALVGGIAVVDLAGGLTVEGGPTLGARLGVSPGHWLDGLSDEELDADLELVAASGVRWIRLDFDWPSIEAAPGELHWATSDRLVARARAHDLEVLGILAYTPAWARPPGTPDKHPPDDPDDFARFAAQVAERYAPRGVTTWEIWNEPNVDDFWAPHPDPERYTELLRRAARSIRAVAPGARVVSGGLAPARDATDGSELSPLAFLGRVLDGGGADSFDAVGVHPYTFPHAPDDPGSWNTFGQLPALRRLTVDAGAPRPFVLSEYGAPSDGVDGMDEARQARLIGEGIERAARWPWVESIFVYSHRDRPVSADELDAHFGLLRVDRSPKASYGTVSSLAASPSDSG